MIVIKKINKKYLGFGIIVVSIATALIYAYIYKWEYRKPFLEIYFFSFNRGRSVFVRTPENRTILIGGGQTSETIREITKVMPFYRKSIDYIIVPSAAPAQIGGLIEILDRYEIGKIIMSKIIATSTALDLLEKKIRKHKIHVNMVERGDGIELEKDVVMDILFPYEGFKFNKTSLPELGFSISYNSTSVYFIGNLSKTIQKDISKIAEKCDCENIIEYYNSAATSKVSPDLLDILDPTFTFSTKEKTAHAVSDGIAWKMD